MATDEIAIASLPVLPAGQVAGGDILPIVDISDLTDPGGTTKGATATVLAQYTNTYNVIFNVKDYGAIGNGVADDTAAIQAAINAAQVYLPNPNQLVPQSPVVYLPSGKYLVTGLTITLPIEIRGYGKQASLIQTVTPDVPAITVNQNAVGNTYFSYYRINNLSIQGSNTTTGFGAQDSQDGIYVTSSTQDVPVWIENIRIALMTGNGINLSQTGDTSRVLNSEVQFCSKAGLAITGTFNTNFLVDNNIFQYNRKGISLVGTGVQATGRISRNLIQSNTCGTGGLGANPGVGTIGSADRPSQGLYMKGWGNMEVVSNYFENHANDLYLDTPVCTYNRFERNIWEFSNCFNLPHTYGGPPLVQMGLYLADGFNNKFIDNLSAERPNRAVTSCTTTEWGTGTFGDLYSHVTDTAGADCFLDNVGLDSAGGSQVGTLVVTNSSFSHVIRNQTGALAGGRNLRNFETFGESERAYNGIREQWIGLNRTNIILTTGNVFNDIIQHATNAATERATRQVQQGNAGTIVTVESVNPFGIVSHSYTDISGTATFPKTYSTATPGSGAHVVGEIVVNSAPAGGAPAYWVCTSSGSPGTWRPITYIPSISNDVGDSNFTWAPPSFTTLRYETNLTANRTVTFNVTNAISGMRARVVRRGLGAFTLTLVSSSTATLKVLPSATAAFADAEFNGTDWMLSAYGTL